MTETEKELRARIARLQAMLDQLDAETARMKEFERIIRRQHRMQCHGRDCER